jgi:CRP-like cAMP-binding protein
MKGGGMIAEDQQHPIRQSPYTAALGEIIYCKGGVPTEIFALCRGWALRFVQLADGRRQNLAVLLPGDLCVTALFQEKLYYSVEALTDVRITRFGRDDLKKRILGDPSLLEIVGRACAAELRDMDERAADLGRRSAEERVTHLILSLVNRLSAHRPRPSQQYAFPLLQRHIADLTGLTSVHVSRVMSEFRNDGIMKLARGILTIANPTELERIARLA